MCALSDSGVQKRPQGYDAHGEQASDTNTSNRGVTSSLLTSSGSNDNDQTMDQRLGPARLSLMEQNSMEMIKSWQEEAYSDIEPGQTGIIARLFQGCLDLFSSLIQNIASSELLPKKAQTSLRRNLAILQLWAHGHSVLDGKLDRVLERSKSLQYTTLATLNSLCGILLNRLSKIVLSHTDEARLSLLRTTNAQVLYEETKWILAGMDETTSDSGSDSDDSEEEFDQNEIDSIVEDIKTYTQCLVDLSAALECPATDPDHSDKEPSIPRLEKRGAYDYYADLIIAKYPKASLEVVECLGKANWDRYQRMQLDRRNNINARMAHVEEHARSTASRPQLANSEFRDSGLGTSVPAHSSTYAETVISFMSSISGGKHIRMPPLPAEAKNGDPFECSACGKHIKATTNREWRKHLFNDLRPYTCFHPRCSFSANPFPNRQLWSTHLELDHKLGPGWESEQCPLCLNPTGIGKSVILIHFARHMEDIALAALPHGIDSEANSEAESQDDSGSESISKSLDGAKFTSWQRVERTTQDDSLQLNNHKEDPLSYNFCLSCDRQITEGDSAYCSEACRLADLEGMGSINPATHSRLPASSHLLPKISGMTLPPAQERNSAFIIHYRNLPNPNPPDTWHKFVQPDERAQMAIQLFSSYRVLRPKVVLGNAVHSSIFFESKTFNQSKTKDIYVSTIRQKILELQGLAAVSITSDPLNDGNSNDDQQSMGFLDWYPEWEHHEQDDITTSTSVNSHNVAHGFDPSAPLEPILDKPCHDCGKIFKRSVDLARHQKTHALFKLGWRTEKDRDRHVNHWHTDLRSEFKCLYPPCDHSSKQESNCNQHMVEVHGWEHGRERGHSFALHRYLGNSQTSGTLTHGGPLLNEDPWTIDFANSYRPRRAEDKPRSILKEHSSERSATPAYGPSLPFIPDQEGNVDRCSSCFRDIKDRGFSNCMCVYTNESVMKRVNHSSGEKSYKCLFKGCHKLEMFTDSFMLVRHICEVHNMSSYKTYENLLGLTRSEVDPEIDHNGRSAASPLLMPVFIQPPSAGQETSTFRNPHYNTAEWSPNAECATDKNNIREAAIALKDVQTPFDLVSHSSETMQRGSPVGAVINEKYRAESMSLQDTEFELEGTRPQSPSHSVSDDLLKYPSISDPGEAINQSLLASVAEDKDVVETLARNGLPNSIEYSVPNTDGGDEKM